MSMPRAATSVQIRMRTEPSRNDYVREQAHTYVQRELSGGGVAHASEHDATVHAARADGVVSATLNLAQHAYSSLVP